MPDYSHLILNLKSGNEKIREEKKRETKENIKMIEEKQQKKKAKFWK